MHDSNSRQLVEGFSELVSQPGIEPIARSESVFSASSLGPDFRGPSGAGTTREWWRPKPADEPDLVWLTAPVPEVRDTIFVFIGDSANLPDNLFPANQATLHVDDAPVLVFDLGLREAARWGSGDWKLAFEPRQVSTLADGYHRQFSPRGCSGLYRLEAPASALRKGQPLRLKVTLNEIRTDAITWFAVRERTDALEVSLSSGQEEIAQLQKELIHMKRIVGALARRAYPEFLAERIPTRDVLIYTQGRNHVHPPDILRLSNGDLLAAFREASEHLSNDGKTVLVRSADGGQTWGQRQVLHESPSSDFRDPSIAELADGTLLMNDFCNASYDSAGRYHGKSSPDHPGQLDGIYIARSEDGGSTWRWSDQPVDPAPFASLHSSERIIELPSGNLLMATHFTRGDDERTGYGCAIHLSENGGSTWRLLSIIAEISEASLCEPALARARSGRLVVVMRNQTGPVFYSALSDDDGATWTPASPTPIPGFHVPASLLELPDGRLLCIYGSRRDPSGIYAVESRDEGQTWDADRVRVIRDDFPNFDCTYTSSVLMPDGQVLAVYYMNIFQRYFIVGSFFRWP